MAGIRQFCEQTVFEQALELFWKKGYSATSMIDLAKETGVQRGSLYNAYQNKTTLFIKAFDYYSQEFLTTIETLLDHHNAKQALTQLFEGLCTRISTDSDNKGCLSTRTIVDVAKDCPEIQTALATFLDKIEALVYNTLITAHRQGQFTGDCKASARYIVALTRGIAVIERAYNDPERLADIYRTAIDQMPFVDH